MRITSLATSCWAPVNIKSFPWGCRGWWGSVLFPYFFLQSAGKRHHPPLRDSMLFITLQPLQRPGCLQEGLSWFTPWLLLKKSIFGPDPPLRKQNKPEGTPRSRHNLTQRHSEAWVQYSPAKSDETQNRKVNSHHHLNSVFNLKYSLWLWFLRLSSLAQQ